MRVKSRKQYESMYRTFMDWCSLRKFESYTEELLLSYFEDLSESYSPNTLWTYYAMLRHQMLENQNINIEPYSKLRKYIKDIQTNGPQGKKSKYFFRDELDTFIRSAPDSIYLATKVSPWSPVKITLKNCKLKVIAIIGTMGNCRICEMHDLTIEDCQDFGTALMITIQSQSRYPRQFTVSGDYYQYCKSYINLRPENGTNKSFFLNYQRGKCTSQCIGKNKFAVLGKQIARFLNLPDPEMYTGSSLRKYILRDPKM